MSWRPQSGSRLYGLVNVTAQATWRGEWGRRGHIGAHRSQSKIVNPPASLEVDLYDGPKDGGRRSWQHRHDRKATRVRRTDAYQSHARGRASGDPRRLRCPSAPSQVARFVGRYRLTHRDVDALLVALTQGDATAAPATGKARIPGGGLSGHDAVADESDAVALVPVQRTRPGALDGAAAVATADTLDDDLAWMFGEDPVCPAPRAADDIVGHVLDDLLGDWSRTGGQLTRAHVALLSAKRSLSSTQVGELLELLEQAGVGLPDSTELRPTRAASKGYELKGDSVGQYLRTIARYPLIDGHREVELWSLISQGRAAQEELDAKRADAPTSNLRRLQTRVEDGRRAHAELICANLRLVISIAKLRMYGGSSVEFADRIQDGNLGLMRAADKFDGSKGFKFSTYATWWIRQSIERGLADRGQTIRIPAHFHAQMQKVAKSGAGGWRPSSIGSPLRMRSPRRRVWTQGRCGACWTLIAHV